MCFYGGFGLATRTTGSIITPTPITPSMNLNPLNTNYARRLVPIIAGLALIALSSCVQTPPSPTHPERLFTEDFESGKLDQAIWTENVTGNNSIEVQSEKVAHGKYALRVRCPVPSNKTWAFILRQPLPEALRQHYFGRVYMYITPAPPARHTIFIMGGTPGFPNNKFEEVATANGRWQLTYVDLRPNGDKEDYHSGGNPPLNRWFCLEWEFNDHPNHAKIWVDGQLVYETDFTVKARNAMSDLVGGFTDVAFGFRLWGAAPQAFDIYYDDIALDTQRIGQLPDPIKNP